MKNGLNEVKRLQKIAGIIKEDNSNVQYYSPDSDTEKRAGLSSFYKLPSRYTSAKNVISWVKKYLSKYGFEQNIRLIPNSKNSFYIISDQTFNTEEIKQKLEQFAKDWMNGEGIQGVKMTLTKPNKIFVEIDITNGIEFENFE